MHGAPVRSGPALHGGQRYRQQVELSQLRAFVAVSRARTIAAAAEYLHVTPSPLSRTIRELERQLGGELFDRNYHELLRTELGERSLPLAVEIVRQADELASISSGSHTTFRYGATPWTSKRLTGPGTDGGRLGSLRGLARIPRWQQVSLA